MVIAASAIVAGGFLVGTSPSASLSETASTAGLVYGALSAFAIAVHAVLIGAALPIVNGSALELAYWSNAGTAVLLAPVVLLNGEGAKVMLASQDLYRWTSGSVQGAALASSEINWTVFIVGSLVTGIFGFLLCVSSLISIKVVNILMRSMAL